jgi:hypothetical protein
MALVLHDMVEVAGKPDIRVNIVATKAHHRLVVRTIQHGVQVDAPVQGLNFQEAVPNLLRVTLTQVMIT